MTKQIAVKKADQLYVKVGGLIAQFEKMKKYDVGQLDKIINNWSHLYDQFEGDDAENVLDDVRCLLASIPETMIIEGLRQLTQTYWLFWKRFKEVKPTVRHKGMEGDDGFITTLSFKVKPNGQFMIVYDWAEANDLNNVTTGGWDSSETKALAQTVQNRT